MNNKLTKKTILGQILLFLAASFIIVYFMPRSDEKRLVYEVDRPWGYPMLKAPFDFTVPLDSVRQREIVDSLDNVFEPVYRFDADVKEAALEAAQKRIAANPLAVNVTDRKKIIQALNKIYDTGIVDLRAYNEIRNGSLPAVKFIDNNIAKSHPTRNFLSERLAYARLDSLLDAPYLRDFIGDNHFSELMKPNVLFDSVATETLRDAVYSKALIPTEVILKGQLIIAEGEMVTLHKYTQIKAYENELLKRGDTNDQNKLVPLLGQIMFVMILLGTLYCYLFFFRREYFNDLRKLSFIVLMVSAFTLLAIVLSSSFTNGIYLVPLTMVPIMVQIFLDSRTALFAHVVTVLVCAMIAVFPLEFLFMQIVAGVVAVVSLRELTRRSQLIRAALFVFLSYCLTFLSIRLFQLGAFDKIAFPVIGLFAINAIMVSFAYVFIFLLEKMFGFTSKVTLVELSDINNPLLRELSEECPGTFQHSMAVSNLASAAATRINANSLLVRAGAMYHDIGKINNPAFFTENQHGVNPHSALDPVQSARIIVGHVTDGLRRADKAKLPSVVRDFISQHHGKGTARYFYTTYCNQHPDEDVDISLFSYPGPNPTTKEASILMMADAVEASSRSLKEHSREAITALVNRIIDTQIAEGLHNDSPLSFNDVKLIKETFISRLGTMYHSRIAYPDKKSRPADTPATPAPETKEP